jgi:aminoglycoside 2'-N-acetyltransferase I
VIELTVTHTADLGPARLAAVRALLDVAFDDGQFTEADWEHSLGGMHALVHDGDDLVAHGSVGQRRMNHHGRALRAGYVEAVAVHPRARRRGHGHAVMGALESVIMRAYQLGALSASPLGEPLYVARGWRQWQGATWALTPRGVQRTADEDEGVYVFPVPGGADLDLTADLTCDWRDGDLW